MRNPDPKSENAAIEWNGLAPAQWDERFARAVRPSLLQSYDYARAACPLYGQRARWGLITIGGREAGLVQALEAGFMGRAVHAVLLDRGPAWFGGFGGPGDWDAFLAAFAREFPRRFGRRRRIIPEIIDTPQARSVLEKHGFRRLNRPGYQTVWLDLRQDEAALLAAMKPQWRNKINKAVRAGLTDDWDGGAAAFSWLLSRCQSDKMTRGYHGPSARVLRALAGVYSGTGRMLLGRALRGGEPLAGVLLFCHGRAATYQAGWSSEEGRAAAAHNFLLWRAAQMLKARGIHDFDLGGVNDETAKGVGDFKKGMGGETVTLAGHYI